MGQLTYTDVKKQSLSVFSQFGEKRWIPFSRENAKTPRLNAEDLQNSGIGKVLVIAAMGASLEGQIDILKKYRDRYDLMTCDKGFGPLLDKGLKADYVMICDTNIPAHYLEPYVLETRDVKLIASCYANLFWTKTWLGDKYFFINRDAIESEEVFKPIMGPGTTMIPASSNVSNAMVVFWTRSDETQQRNWGGYEKYLLVGFDYSWRPEGNYYAWMNPKPKCHYMKQITNLDMNGDYVFTSHNLMFSARWLLQYLTAFRGLPVFNCSGRGLLDVPRKASLERELAAICPRKESRDQIKNLYEITRSGYASYVAAKAAFDKAREEFLWQ